MYNANGCGLAAPQVNQSLCLFIVDSKSIYETYNPDERKQYFETGDTGIVETFTNAKVISRSKSVWFQEEGCLSIPGIGGLVPRNWSVTLEYPDRHFDKKTKTFSGKTAGMIQHEYDHTQGILYLDHLDILKRQLLENKLKRLRRGNVKIMYPIEFLQ
uniref:peptide deformylase n=1 Tax=Dyadobacter crusticola TaxID=292407 RepID=UPI001969E79E|nr:peptide deformylase [Dyadobacter crusticola]